jgi:hypothetical protein
VSAVIHAVIFNIGGVLEVTPPTGHTKRWEAKLGLAAGERDRTMADVWWEGSLDTASEAEVHAAFAEQSSNHSDDFLRGSPAQDTRTSRHKQASLHER